MPSGHIGGISIRSWAYFVGTLIFLRELFEFALGFSSSLWLLLGALFTSCVLLIGAAALSSRGMGTYRIFFIFYFVLVVSSFIVLVIASFLLQERHPRSSHTDRRHHHVKKAWESHAYICSGFALLVVKLIFGWLMLKAYYYDQFCEEDRRAAPYEQSARDWSDEFDYSMTDLSSSLPQYTKEYSALSA